MKTGSIGNIRVQASKGSSNVHNFSHNLYTSCGFGEVSPTKCLQCDADSKTNLKEEFLCYLADLNAPTYGHVNVNFWHYFVEIEDLFSIFPQLLAQIKIFNVGRDPNDPNTNGMNIPIELPWVPRNLLCMMLLIGASVSVYKVRTSLNGSRYLELPVFQDGNATQIATYSTFQSKFRDDLNAFCQWKSGLTSTEFLSTSPVRINGFDLGIDTLGIDVRALCDCSLANLPTLMRIPLSNISGNNLGERYYADGTLYTSYDGVDQAPVTIEGADFIIERDFRTPVSTDTDPDSYKYVFAFRMHAFGKRLFKIFKGLEFQEDFTDDTPQSLAPFMATFKAYWNSFGLEYYENYENTYAAMISRTYDSTAGQMRRFYALFAEDATFTGITQEEKIALYYVKGFLFHLGTMWFTDSQDFVSAQQHEITNSPSVDSTFVRSFTPLVNAFSANGNPVLENPTDGADPTGTFGTNDHAYIDNVFHGQLSSEVLKKLYLYTNRNTIAGKRVRELLEMQGLGKWADKQKIRFIGHDVKNVDFDQVVSTANTENNGKGDLLGGRGGRGQAYQEGKSHFYHNDNIGYLITLCAVVPDAGYTQSHNPAFDCLKKYDFFIRDYDGLGMEATRIKQINGERPVKLLNDDGSEPSQDTERVFGFAPRMSRFKYCANILSGHFAQRSTRDYFLTYNTDKFLDVGEVSVTSDTYTGALAAGTYTRKLVFTQVFPYSEFPLAGPHWRYVARYPWLGHYTRIFAALGDNVSRFNSVIKSIAMLRRGWEYLNSEEDGFSIMATVSIRQRNKMLQIADSYETTDDSNEGKTNMNTSKA